MHPRLQWLRDRADPLPDTDLDGTAARIREGAAMTPESIWLVVASAMLASIGLDTDSRLDGTPPPPGARQRDAFRPVRMSPLWPGWFAAEGWS